MHASRVLADDVYIHELPYIRYCKRYEIETQTTVKFELRPLFAVRGGKNLKYTHRDFTQNVDTDIYIIECKIL